MGKVTLKIEIEEDYLESIKASTNKTSSDIILINATPMTESDDAVSRQAVLKKLRGCLTGGETEYRYVKLHIDSIHSVLPKREQDEYDEDYKTLQIKLENAEVVIENLKEDLRQAREDL